ncbi:uncharacterized protein LOC111945013, partial [Cyanistes caeruleus]|uniref:uncharacterized protein LOC111945013 n=1 Tax=Cyanistes caeruleus TaxID=156563 RepID=UPI000CDA8394
MPCQTEGELLPAREQKEQLGQQVEEALENGQNIKAEPQAELPEAQSAIVAVKRRPQEDMRNIQEEMTLYRQRRDQQNKVSDRVAATPLIKLSLSCVLEDSKENLQAEMQDIRARIKEREKRLEEEMKMVEEEINHLIQEKNFLHKQVSETAIATAVTAVWWFVPFLPFPCRAAGSWGDAPQCHPAVVSIPAALKEISWCAESQLLLWTVAQVAFPFCQHSSECIPAGLFLLSLFLQVFLQVNTVTQIDVEHKPQAVCIPWGICSSPARSLSSQSMSLGRKGQAVVSDCFVLFDLRWKGVLTSHLAAWEGFQQMTGDEEPQ